MTRTPFDVIGIGNAIVDIVSPVDDQTIERLGMTKGAMTLVDEKRSGYLRAYMQQCVQLCGGSAAIAALGARVGYIGKVRDDALGNAFRHDLAALGVHYPTGPEPAGPPTAHCLIFVTPDAQRTMNTYLGACTNLTSRDIHRDVIEASHILYLEGYLFDPPHAQEAFREAASMAHAGQTAGCPVPFRRLLCGTASGSLHPSSRASHRYSFRQRGRDKGSTRDRRD
jgi:sugar/nucleoside kinase (ribokinase family)